MVFLKEGDPARYHLSTTKNGIQVAVNRLTAPQESDFSQKETDEIARRLRLPSSFIFPSINHEWGFGPVLRQEESPNSNWILYSCNLPKALDEKGILADTSYATSATLGILFDFLAKSEKQSNSRFPQLLQIEMRNNREKLEAPLIVTLNSPLVQWLRRNMSNSLRGTVAKSIRDGFTQMWNDRDLKDNTAFNIEVKWNEPKWIGINFSAAGPGSGLGASYIDYRGGDPVPRRSLNKGYALEPHNLSSPVQQLGILVGIAKIEELAIKNPLMS